MVKKKKSTKQQKTQTVLWEFLHLGWKSCANHWGFSVLFFLSCSCMQLYAEKQHDLLPKACPFASLTLPTTSGSNRGPQGVDSALHGHNQTVENICFQFKGSELIFINTVAKSMGGDTNLSLHFRGKYVLSTRSWLQRTEEAVKILRIFWLFFCIAEFGVAFLGTVKTPIQESCKRMTEEREKQQQQQQQ